MSQPLGIACLFVAAEQFCTGGGSGTSRDCKALHAAACFLRLVYYKIRKARRKFLWRDMDVCCLLLLFLVILLGKA